MLLILALAQPSARLGNNANLPLLVLEDVSASTAGQPQRLRTLPTGIEPEVIRFAQGIEQPASTQPASQQQTNLAPALRLAAAKAGENSGLLVISDGQWHDEWQSAAQALANKGIRPAIIPLESPPRDGRIASLQCVRIPGRNAVAIQVTARANAPMNRRLVLRRDGVISPLLERTIDLRDLASFSVSDDVPADAAAVYRAELAPADKLPQNDSMSCAVPPQQVSYALVAPGQQAASLSRLTNQMGGFQPVQPADAPQKADDWLKYSAVLLISPTGQELSSQARMALAAYVRQGGGLVLLGSGPRQSPADRDDPLNQVAALLANPFQRRPIDLRVVLDASGSMAQSDGGGIKFQTARQAVLSLQKHLTPADSLQVITYNDTPRMLYSSGGGQIDFSTLQAALLAVQPAGPTRVMPALSLAADAPPGQDKMGLIVLVSDLQTEGYDSAMVDQADGLLRRNDLKLSIIATGSASSSQPAQTSLDALARRLGARVIRRADLAGLAEVFQQLLLNLRGQAIVRNNFSPAFIPSFGLGNISLGLLDAYIVSAPQDSAEVLGTVQGNAILARRAVGLGRSVSLAIPAGDADNKAALESPGMAELLLACVRWAARPAADPRFALDIQPTAPGQLLVVSARDGDGPMNLLNLRARLASDDAASDIPLAQTAPGRYEATLPATIGTSALSLVDHQGRTLLQQALSQGCSPEFEAIGANMENLTLLARITGGRVIAAGQVDDIEKSVVAQGSTPLWPYGLAAALLLMLIDWCVARVLRHS